MSVSSDNNSEKNIDVLKRVCVYIASHSVVLRRDESRRFKSQSLKHLPIASLFKSDSQQNWKLKLFEKGNLHICILSEKTNGLGRESQLRENERRQPSSRVPVSVIGQELLSDHPRLQTRTAGAPSPTPPPTAFGPACLLPGAGRVLGS